MKTGSQNRLQRDTPFAKFILAALIGLVAVAYAVRVPLLSGGEKSMVDIIDGRLILSTIEHVGATIFIPHELFDPPWFYPQEGVLGYTDTFLLTALPHRVLLYAGFTSIQALTATMALMALVGYWSFYQISRRLGIAPGLATIGGLLFIAGIPIQVAARNSHIQLLAIWLLPLLMLCAWKGIDAWGKNRLGIGQAWLSLAFCFYALIAVSYFYIAWYFALTCIIAGAIAFAIGTTTARQGIAAIVCPTARRRLRALWMPVLVAAPVAVLFLAIYLPPKLENGGRIFREALPTLPRLSMLGTQNDTNLFWRHWIGLNPVDLSSSLPNEVHYGFPWLFLVLFLTCGAFAFIKRSEASLRPGAIAFATVIATWLIILRVGDFSLWAGVMKVIPGADGIRAVFRVNMLLYALAIITIASALPRVADAIPLLRRGGLRAIAAILVGVTLLLENAQSPMHEPLSAADQSKIEQIVSDLPPPKDAEAFIVIHEAKRPLGQWDWNKASAQSHTIAIQLARHWGVPTINGYSGLAPAGWNLGLEIAANAFEAPAANWIQRHSISGPVYVLNLDSLAWAPLSQYLESLRQAKLAELTDAMGREIDFGINLRPGDAFLESGFHPGEPTGRWLATEKATFHVKLSLDDWPLRFVLEGHYFGGSQETPVWVDGNYVGSIDFSRSRSLPIPADTLQRESSFHSVTIGTRDARSPHESGLSEDRRKLKLWISKIRFERAD